MLEGKSVLVTGGSGSFGLAFAERALTLGPRRVILLSRNEKRLDEAKKRLGSGPDHPMRYMVGDVRDRDRLLYAFRGVDVVVHAAAQKRVDTCEDEPREAFLSNVVGSDNVMNAAIWNAVSRVLYLSTDKAVAPDTTYGATKLLGERILLGAGNRLGAPTGTRFAATRYGNVLGSAGSVVEYWRAALATGHPLLIRGENVSRFWMTMAQAVDLVLWALRDMRGGEVYVPCLGAATLATLADALAPHHPRRSVAIGDTEKLSEWLIATLEVRRTYEREGGYVIEPPARPWESRPAGPTGSPVPPGFAYSSETARRLSVAELREMLGVIPQAEAA